MPDPEQSTSQLDVDTPNIARMYDYFLGGSAHFAVDRAAAEQFLDALPGNRTWTLHYTCGNRAFLGRAVRALSQLGIDQFLDLGSGVPTVGAVHTIAQKHTPHARVAYVDIEPVAVHHTRNLVGTNAHVSATQADIRQPQTVLSAAGVAELVDFARPVAILAVGILDLIADEDDPGALMQAYRDACPAGSAVVLSHAVQHAATDEQVTAFQRLMARTNTPQIQFRTREQVARLHTGYRLLEPGLVPFQQWRPERPVSEHEAAQANGYGAVGLVPYVRGSRVGEQTRTTPGTGRSLRGARQGR